MAEACTSISVDEKAGGNMIIAAENAPNENAGVVASEFVSAMFLAPPSSRVIPIEVIVAMW